MLPVLVRDDPFSKGWKVNAWQKICAHATADALRTGSNCWPADEADRQREFSWWSYIYRLVWIFSIQLPAVILQSHEQRGLLWLRHSGAGLGSNASARSACLATGGVQLVAVSSIIRHVRSAYG